MHTDAQRRQLYNELSGLLSAPSTDVLMDLLPPVGWADVARQSDIALLRADMSELGSQLHGEIVELRADMSELGSRLHGEIVELRADMTALLPRLITVNLASMIGVAGLVMAAMQLS